MPESSNKTNTDTDAEPMEDKIEDFLTTPQEGYKYRPSNDSLPEGGDASTADELYEKLQPREDSSVSRIGRTLFLPDTGIRRGMFSAILGISAIFLIWLIVAKIGITFFLPETFRGRLWSVLIFIIFIALITASGRPLFRHINQSTRNRINSEQDTLAIELMTGTEGNVYTMISTSSDPMLIKNVYETLGAPGSIKIGECEPKKLLEPPTGSIAEDRLHLMEIDTIEQSRGDRLIGSREEQLLEDTADRNLCLDQLVAAIGEENEKTTGTRYYLQLVVSPRRYDKSKSTIFENKYKQTDHSTAPNETDDKNRDLLDDVDDILESALSSIFTDTERVEAHKRTQAECTFNIAVRALAITDGKSAHEVNQTFDRIEQTIEAKLHHTLATTSTRFSPGDPIPFFDRLLNREPRKELIDRFDSQAVGQRPLTIGAQLRPKRKTGLIDDKRNIWSYLLLSNDSNPVTGRMTGSRPRDQSGKQRPSEESLDPYLSDSTDDPYGWNIDSQSQNTSEDK